MLAAFVGVIAAVCAVAWVVLGALTFFTRSDGSTRFVEAVISAYAVTASPFSTWPALTVVWLILDARERRR